MSSHGVYQEIYNRLYEKGCKQVTLDDFVVLANNVLRAISQRYPTKCNDVESLIYSIIYHHAIINGDTHPTSLKQPYNSVAEKNGYRIEFYPENFPYSLVQILYTFFNDLAGN